MGTPEDETGRYRQRRRTRAEILAAANRLVQEGRTPSMSEVAEAAGVSRRTLYLHFPTLDQLVLDATLGALSEGSVDAAFAASLASVDPRDRTDQMVSTVADESAATLALGRRLIRLTVDVSPPAATTAPTTPRRGYRRIEWLERALEPVAERLTPTAHDRLLSGLAVLLGWEALVVLEDVRGLASEERRTTVLWAARALIDAALTESAAEAPGPD